MAAIPALSGSLSIDLPGADDNWVIKTSTSREQYPGTSFTLKNVHNVGVTSCL